MRLELPLACMIRRATRMTAMIVGVATPTSKRELETVPAWLAGSVVVTVVVARVALPELTLDEPGGAKTLTVALPVIVSGSIVVPFRRPTLTTRFAVKLEA